MIKGKGKAKKTSPGQINLKLGVPWNRWEVPEGEIREVTEKFVRANCFDPENNIVLQSFSPLLHPT